LLVLHWLAPRDQLLMGHGVDVLSLISNVLSNGRKGNLFHLMFIFRRDAVALELDTRGERLKLSQSTITQESGFTAGSLCLHVSGASLCGSRMNKHSLMLRCAVPSRAIFARCRIFPGTGHSPVGYGLNTRPDGEWNRRWK